MAELGDIRRVGRWSTKEILVECPDCHCRRWVSVSHATEANYTGLCRPCNNRHLLDIYWLSRHNKHRDKRIFTLEDEHHTSDYVRLFQPTHPRADKYGRVKRAVLVIEKHIGRFLLPDEEPHHLNHVKSDDRIENLMLTTHREHRRIEKNVKNRYEMARLRAKA